MTQRAARILTGVALSALVALSTATNAWGTAWLAENGGKEGVVTLPSGLQYRVLRRGHGDSHPTSDSSCSCHYEGRMAKDYPSGKVFDSSYARGEPTSFAPNQVIAGWTEAMQLMVEGDLWEMYIPSELAYGESGSPPSIAGGSALVFKMEIVAIEGDKVPAVRCDVTTLDGCSDLEAAFVRKQALKGKEERARELTRLEGLVASKTTPEKIAWMKSRLALLRQIVKDEL
jgi:FKBP-type peptidyl-prolyl cis-trans isomerase FklB